MGMLFCLLAWLLCIDISDVHAQGGYSHFRSMERQRRQYWLNFAKAKAAGKDLNYYLRNEVILGYAIGKGYLKLHRHYEDEGAHYYFDTTINTTLKPKYAYVLSGCSGYPLIQMSSDAALIFTYGAAGSLTKYDMGKVELGNYTTNIFFSSFSLGVPLGLDLKIGGEAKLDKSKRFCLTAGAGLQPTWMSTNMSALESSSHLVIMPFAKAEIGFLTGFAGFKLRGTYLSGGYDSFYREAMANGIDAKLSNGGQFVVSLVILNMLRHWED